MYDIYLTDVDGTACSNCLWIFLRGI